MANQFGEKLAPEPGSIVMWSGALSNIPAGWYLCDGNNGTPNLLDRFAHGVSSSTTDPGGTGGTASKTLSGSQLPSHSHTGSVGGAGGHNHNIDTLDSAGRDGTTEVAYYDGTQGDQSVPTNYSGSHSHTTSGTGNTGASSPSSINNLPSHYEIAFIQKA